MKVLMITSELGNDGGGLALTCSQLISILQKLGCRVEIEISIKNDGYFALDGGYDPELGAKLRYAVRLRQCVDKCRAEFMPDVLIAYGAGANGYFARLLAKKLGKPYCVVLCGSEINIAFASARLAFFNRTALTEADRVIGLSNELIDNAKLFDDAPRDDKYFVIPNAYDFDRRDFSLRIDPTKPLVFACGSAWLSEKKGIANLIRAFAMHLKKSERRDRLQLYGRIDGDIERQYRDLISELKVEGDIELCGYLERKKYCEEMSRADIYIQMSPFEGCCNAIGEAIADGKFVLISDTGYFAEQLKPRFPELVSESLKPEAIAESIGRYINRIETRDVRRAVLEFLAPSVSFDTVLNQWRNVLRLDQSIVSPIVMFHAVENVFSGIDYPSFAFESLVELAVRKGFRFCSHADYARAVDRERLIICTFDDGYESVYRNAYPVLRAHGFTATVFVCPDLIGKSNDWNRRDEVVRFHMDSRELGELRDGGWEIGSHGLGHYNMLRLSQTQLEECLTESKRQLEARFGEVKCFCYPYGEHRPYIRQLISRYYEAAFAVNVGGSDWYRDRYQLTRLVPEELKKLLECMS